MVKKNPLFKSRDRFLKELVFYKDFQGFKAHIRSKNFQTPKEMRKYLSSKSKPMDIPHNPEVVYSKENVQLRDKYLTSVKRIKDKLIKPKNQKRKVDLSKSKTHKLSNTGSGGKSAKAKPRGKSKPKKDARKSAKSSNTRKSKVGIRTITIKMANGKTRRQKQRVFSNGKTQFVKN